MFLMRDRSSWAKVLLIVSLVFAVLSVAAAVLSGNPWLLIFGGVVIPTSLYLLKQARSTNPH